MYKKCINTKTHHNKKTDSLQDHMVDKKIIKFDVRLFMRCTKKHEEFMFNFIKKVCEDIGPRSPCSKEEAQCANFLQKQLNKYCDETLIDEFYCQPGAYRAMFHWPVILYIFAIPFYLFLPWVSLLLTIFALVILIGNEMYNMETIDIFFKKQKSTNVIGKIKPTKQTKNIIILSGHHDSNWEFPMGKQYGTKVSIFMTLPIIFNSIISIFSTIKIIKPLPELLNYIFIIILIAASLVMIPFFIKVISKTPVTGANDNLSALAVCLTAAQYFSDPKNKLSNSELWIVSFGCEEIGIRGSKRFISKYFETIKDAFNINFDLIGEKGCEPYIDRKEEMGLIKLSPEICDILENAGKKVGIPMKQISVMCFTDSMAFAMKKLRSASIVSFKPDGKMPSFYHTVDDKLENVDPHLLRKCLEVCFQAVNDIDSKFS